MKKLYFTEEEKKKAKSESDRQYRLQNQERINQRKREYYLANRERHLELMSKHYAENKQEYKDRSKKWKLENRAKWNSQCMMRHAKKLKATPQWLSDDDKWMIEQAYELAKLREVVCGGKWHVDHIVPLQGKTVSGLHVPWNLQVIPASENCSKKNSWK